MAHRELTKFETMRITTRWMTPDEAEELARELELSDDAVEQIKSQFEWFAESARAYAQHPHLNHEIVEEDSSDDQGRILLGQDWEGMFEGLAEAMGCADPWGDDRERVDVVFRRFFAEG